MDTFADVVCDVISKGVVQLMNNGGGNEPQPPPNKKPKLGTDMPQQEECHRRMLATPGTKAHATSYDNNKIYDHTSNWDKQKAAFLGPSAVLWEKKLDVIVQTPVRTVFPTAELKTPGTPVEKLTIDPLLLDGGQGKIKNVMESPE